MKILIPLAGIIDKAAETARLNKEIEKAEKNQQGLQTRLSNPKFVDKAPAKVVDQVKQQAERVALELDQLKIQRDKIAQL